MKKIQITLLGLIIVLAFGTFANAQTAPPVLNTIGAQGTTENILLSFGVTATDADVTIPTLTTSTLPTGASFIDNGDGTGTFDWTPTFLQSGAYNVTFYANDVVTADIDSELVVITVTEAGNQLPVLAAIGAQGTTENVLLSFGVSATDIESIPTLTTSALPTGASFIDNGDGTGSFSWTPTFLQSGSYNVTFTATDDSTATDFEIVTITVTEAGNQLPVLAAIGAQGTTENVLLSFGVSATDIESIPTLTTSALPTGASFIDNGDGTGSFSWTPTFLQSGSYNVTFTATDDSTATDFEIVTITVTEAGNQLPVLAAIGAQGTTENVLLSFGVSATDIESIPTLTTSALPTGASFIDNGDGTGSFSWTPDFLQSGSYNVTFTATDDSTATDFEIVTITVAEAGNQLPVLATIGAQGTTENVLLSFGVSATDIESIPTLTTSALPTGASFIDNGDGTGSFSWTPTFLQSGSYNVTFTATDDSTATDFEIVTITVTEAGNQLPVLAAIGAQGTTENVLLSFGVSATDIESIPTLTTSALPTGASFIDNGDGTGSFSWTPDFLQSGSYNITFTATDDSTATDFEIVTITVTEAGNQLPILAAIGAQNVNENVQLTFGVSATDIESIPTLTTSALPTGASFIDNGDGTGTFDWTPTYIQSGVYNITFTASDDSTATDFEVVTITVNEMGNQLPILATIGSQTSSEGVLLSFVVSASDAESTPSLTTSALPTGATFIDNGDGTGSFNWTPDFTQGGGYSVTFTATDDSTATDAEAVIINILESGNQAPAFTATTPQVTTENVNLNFNLSATDPDGTTPVLSAGTLPTGASFVNNGDGTGTFDWTPTFFQSGVYNVDFYATDGVLSDTETVAITVNEAGNQLPVLAAIGAQSGTENVLLTFNVSATDIESTPSLTTSALPTGASFIDNGDGTGTFDWTPSFTDAGVYNVTFTATDDSAATDDEIVTITISDGGNQAPIVTDIPDQTLAEGASFATINLDDFVSDVDNLDSEMTWSFSGNTELSVSIDVNRVATITTPNIDWNGSESITFTATDPGLAFDSDPAIFTLTAVNDEPVLAAIGAQAGTENVLLTFGTSASDIDGTIPTLSSSTLPTGAIYTDNGNGTGTFDWTPDFIQSGIYNITFYATDGIATDSELVAITIAEVGNQLPVLTPIGLQTGTEGLLLNFTVTASDPESTPVLTAVPLPTGATFVDNGDGTGTFNWTPDFTQAGGYNITFTATDDSLATDAEIVGFNIFESGNQAPVFAAATPQVTTENINLNFSVTSSDPDGTTPVLSSGPLPSGASFIDNGDGTGTLDWTPTFFQSGVYNVDFFATDGVLSDTETVAITVNEAGNQLPVLASIGAQGTTENVLLSFGISATDAESTPVLTTSALPTGASFIDNGDGTGSFSWTPDFLQSGSYGITFTATDDSIATDFELVTITVTEAGNQLPVLAAIGAQNGTEDIQLTFNVSATDIESTPTLTTSALPTGATFIDNGDGTGTFDWTPGFTDAGIYNVTFTATDDSLAFDDEIVTITIGESGNQAPVLAAIGPQSTTENVLLTFNISATDADATIPSLTTSVLPTGASFIDNGDGTGTFNWTPDFLQSGSYNITFTASDGVLTDDEIVTITVNEAGNQLPILAAIGAQATTENVQLTFGVSATDIESIPTLTTSALPTGASFIDNGDGTGTFDWTPTFLQSGSYNITFTATDDSVATDFEVVTITVTEAGNQLPLLAAIGAQSTTENIQLLFNISATDAESITALTTSALPIGASFIDNGDGTATFDWTPTFTDAGSYNVTFYATDDSAAVDSELVAITVNEAGNQNPVVTDIPDQVVAEGASFATINLDDFVSDDDNLDSEMTWTFSGNVELAVVLDVNRVATITPPDANWNGSETITFTATDPGLLFASDPATFTVSGANDDPVLATIGAQATTENIALNIPVSATDADGTIPTLSTSTLPTGATFIDNADGTGSFDWTPDFLQSGIYNVTFYASDGIATDSELVAITVNEAGNQSPVLTAIGAQGTTENVQLTFGVSASDIESIPTLTTSALPTGATFIDNGDGTGTFDWTPDFLQSGVYNITFTATDDSVAFVDEIVTITVTDGGNQLPVLTAIGAQGTTENVLLSFAVSASDTESIPTLTAAPLPTGAIFTDNGDGTGTFDWTPDFTQSGSYNVTFTATDDSLAIASEIVTITVAETGNQAPVMAAIGAQVTTENVLLSVPVSASDLDGTIPTLTTSVLPTGAIFTDNGDGTGSLDWTPDFFQSGVYNVDFYATDGVLSDTETVAITVTDAGNQLPVLTAIGAQSVGETVQLTFGVSASDIESIPTLTAAPLPTGATFIDNGDGTGTFDWIPTFTDAGVYNVTFTATDDSAGFVDEIVTITVTDAGNQLPVLAAIGPQTVDEGVQLLLNISATDADNIPTLTTSALPTGALFTDNGDGTAVFDWTPDFNQGGVIYNVDFYASDGIATDTETVAITVNETGDQAPIFGLVNDTTISENQQLLLTLAAVDPEGLTPVLTSGLLPTGATFVDNGDGTGTFDWTPNFTQNGTYVLNFFASDGTNTGNLTFTVTVGNFDQPPVLDSIGPKSISANRILRFVTSATDPDGTIPTMTSSALPSGATYTDNGDGTAEFYWQTDFTDVGSFLVTFIANDAISADSEQVSITVIPANQPPVLADIPPQTVTEGDVLNVPVSASDPDATIPALRMEDAPLNSTFTDNGDGTGTFTFIPNFIQAGLSSVRIVADDGIDTDKQNVLIQVYDAGDQAPQFDSIPSPSVTEGQVLEGAITGFDPDTLSVFFYLDTATVPANFTLFDSGNGVASYTFTPDYTQSGVYIIGIIISDGTLETTVTIDFTVVEAGNQPPVIAPISDATVGELNNLTFTVSSSDPDGDFPVLTAIEAGAGSLPGSALLTDNGDGTGAFSWTPDATSAGIYDIVFFATDAVDALLYDSTIMQITVLDTNRVPTYFINYGGTQILEGDTLTYQIFTDDPDQTIPTVRAFLENSDTLATNMTFDLVGNTGTITFIPDNSQGSEPTPTFYNVRFEVCDELDPALCVTTSPATTRVLNRNAAPEMSFNPNAGPFTIIENDILNFTVTAFDTLDGDAITDFRAENLPANATFVGQPNFKTFTFQPSFTQAGSYQVSFITVDAAGLADTVLVDITVNDAGNQFPFFTTVLTDPTLVYISQGLSLPINTVEPDGEAVTISATIVPTNATFVDNGDGSALFTYNPDATQFGQVDSIVFIVTDPLGQADSIGAYFAVTTFTRGDLDNNTLYTMNDIVYIVNYLYRGGAEPQPMTAGDVDNNGSINVADIAYLINYMYNSGPRPPQ